MANEKQNFESGPLPRMTRPAFIKFLKALVWGIIAMTVARSIAASFGMDDSIWRMLIQFSAFSIAVYVIHNHFSGDD